MRKWPRAHRHCRSARVSRAGGAIARAADRARRSESRGDQRGARRRDRSHADDGAGGAARIRRRLARRQPDRRGAFGRNRASAVAAPHRRLGRGIAGQRVQADRADTSHHLRRDLPEEKAEHRHGNEGVDIGPHDVEKALGERGVVMQTSRPSPLRFREVYDAANSSDAPSAATPEPESSAATIAISPQAIAASIAERRFSACAGSSRVIRTKRSPIAK